MIERTFLIERYCSGMWPQVTGLRPFIVAGPRLFDWVIQGSLQEHGRHLLKKIVLKTLFEVFPQGGPDVSMYQHRATAEAMLREGILSALWAVEQKGCRPMDNRWDESIDQVAREMPFKHPSSFAPPGIEHWNIWESVAEYLSGIPTPAMARDYVSEDMVVLEAVSVPEG